MSSILSRAPPYRMLTELPPSIRILDARQLLMCMVTIKASFCEKCTIDVSESENNIGLLGANDGRASTMGYLLL